MAHIHNVFDSDNHFIINAITRKITNTAAQKTSLVQGDHNSERFTFDAPRYVDGHDMSLCNRVEIHYCNASATEKSEDVYTVDDLAIVEISESEDGAVSFSWLISGNATKHAGSLAFIVRFVCLTGDVIDYAWHTEIFKNITISNGMNNSEAAISEYSDVLAAWENKLDAMDEKIDQTAARIPTLLFGYYEDVTPGDVSTALARGNPIAIGHENNVIFTSFHFDSDGDVVSDLFNQDRHLQLIGYTSDNTWELFDYGIITSREYVDTVAARIPTDYLVSGEQTVVSTEDGGENVYTFTDSTGQTSTLAVKNGSRGATGETGATGADGYTPVKGVDYFTEEDKAALVQDVLAALPVYDGEVI